MNLMNQNKLMSKVF